VINNSGGGKTSAAVLFLPNAYIEERKKALYFGIAINHLLNDTKRRTAKMRALWAKTIEFCTPEAVSVIYLQ